MSPLSADLMRIGLWFVQSHAKKSSSRSPLLSLTPRPSPVPQSNSGNTPERLKPVPVVGAVPGCQSTAAYASGAPRAPVTVAVAETAPASRIAVVSAPTTVEPAVTAPVIVLPGAVRSPVTALDADTAPARAAAVEVSSAGDDSSVYAGVPAGPCSRFAPLLPTFSLPAVMPGCSQSPSRFDARNATGLVNSAATSASESAAFQTRTPAMRPLSHSELFVEQPMPW